MDKQKIEQVYDLVSEIVSRDGGNDILYMANIMRSLMEAEPEEELTKGEMVELTKRLFEASTTSAVPVLTQERVDAVRWMLEYGIPERRFPDLNSATPEQTKQLLLNCDMDVFTDLVDFVAVDNEAYYAPDGPVLNSASEEKINEAISAAVKNAIGIDGKIQSAETIKNDLTKTAAFGGRIQGLGMRDYLRTKCH